ncbi:MAG: glycosyltransferase family 4 protein [Candidatus Bathyarchaeia archaeon]
MKTIGIVHYTAPKREVGGVEAVIDHHTRLLREREYEVHLIYGAGGNVGYPGVEEHEIPLLSPRHKDVQRIHEVIMRKGENEAFNAVKSEVKDRLKDFARGMKVLIIHNIPSMPFNYPATAAVNELVDEVKAKIIFWLHDSFLFRVDLNVVKNQFPINLLHHYSPKVTYVTPTEFRAKQFREMPEPYRIPSINVIPNGVELEDYIKIDETTKLLMRKLGLSFEDEVLLVPVRVTPRKNIELALFVADELKHLMRDARQVKVLITGPPDHQAVKEGVEYLDYLKELIERRGLEENVIFCHEVIGLYREYENGEIVKWSVADVYNIADLIFIPSREEGFGMPIIEAGAARKPVFCSRIPPFKELIRDDIEGYMFDLNDDPKSIAFRIYKLFITDRVESNFHNVIKRFSWDTICDKKIIPLIS